MTDQVQMTADDESVGHGRVIDQSEIVGLVDGQIADVDLQNVNEN